MAELTSTVVKYVEQSFLSFERKGSHVYLGGQIRGGAQCLTLQGGNQRRRAQL